MGTSHRPSRERHAECDIRWHHLACHHPGRLPQGCAKRWETSEAIFSDFDQGDASSTRTGSRIGRRSQSGAERVHGNEAGGTLQLKRHLLRRRVAPLAPFSHLLFPKAGAPGDGGTPQSVLRRFAQPRCGPPGRISASGLARRRAAMFWLERCSEGAWKKVERKMGSTNGASRMRKRRRITVVVPPIRRAISLPC